MKGVALWFRKNKRELLTTLLLVASLIVMIVSLGEIERLSSLYFGGVALSFVLYFSALAVTSVDILKLKLNRTFLDSCVMLMLIHAFLMFGWFRISSGSFLLLKDSILVPEVPLLLFMVTVPWLLFLGKKERSIRSQKGA